MIPANHEAMGAIQKVMFLMVMSPALKRQKGDVTISAMETELLAAIRSGSKPRTTAARSIPPQPEIEGYLRFRNIPASL